MEKKARQRRDLSLLHHQLLFSSLGDFLSVLYHCFPAFSTTTLQRFTFPSAQQLAFSDFSPEGRRHYWSLSPQRHTPLHLATKSAVANTPRPPLQKSTYESCHRGRSVPAIFFLSCVGGGAFSLLDLFFRLCITCVSTSTRRIFLAHTLALCRSRTRSLNVWYFSVS